MNGMTDSHEPQPSVRDRAVEWHVRLGSDGADEADWLAFEAWLVQAPEHQAAYEAVEALWMELDEIPSASVKVVRLKPRRPVPAWFGAIAASLVAAVALGITVKTMTPPTTVYETARGERRTIALADGTHIQLNSGSHIAVTLGRKARQVDMADAEAVFDVAKDAGRPFLITAGDRQIRVVGTEFNVLRHNGRLDVTVRRGVVEVRPAASPGGAALAQLRKGQALSHREGASADTVSIGDPGMAFAWTTGQVVYRDRPLAEVAADLNRYVTTPIVVVPEARGLRLTAVINVDDEQAMLRTLAQFLPVIAIREGGQVQIRLRPTGR